MRSRCLPPAARPPRRGAILLVVLAMLALFAVLGLSFVLYAESSATAARINREAEDLGNAGAIDALLGDAEFAEAAGKAVGKMLFDAPDTDATAATSGFRGYGLVRLKYGQDRTLLTNPGLSPFAGQGLIADTDAQDGSPLGLPTTQTGGTISVNRSGIVNYAWQPGEKHILDPEWTKFRQAATAGNPTTSTDLAVTTSFTDGTRAYRNVAAAYTFPDMKDLPLAVVSTVKQTVDVASTPPKTREIDVGTVLQPSFFRYGPVGTTGGPAWVFNGSSLSGDPLMRLAPPASVSPTGNNGQTAATDDWLIAAGRLKMIRPRPTDHAVTGDDATKPVFPYVPANADGTYTGDVQNLPSAGPQRNDSLWVYPAGPVVTVNNKQYTALVAPLVLDLCGRVNLSTAGNLLKQGTTAPRTWTTGDDHASSMGVGRWEVNPRWVLDPNVTTRTSLSTDPKAGSQTALRNLLTGVNGTDQASKDNRFNQFTAVGGAAVSVAGRYGTSAGTTYPSANPAFPAADPITGQPAATFNGTGLTANLPIPPHYSRTDFDAVGVGADWAKPVGGQYSPFPAFPGTRFYDGTTTTTAQELNNHPAQFSPSFFQSSGAAGRTFPASDVRWLGTRVAGKAEDYSNAEVARLMASQLIAGGTSDLTGTPTPPRYDTTKSPSGPQTFAGTTPTTTAGTYNPSPYGPFADANKDPAILTRMLVTTISNSTHRPELRINLQGSTPTAPITAPLGPVDMTRPLTDYRYNSTATPLTGADWTPDKVLVPANANQVAQVQAAQASRQRFARDIFVRLAAVYTNWQIGTGQPTTPVIDGTNVWYVNDPANPAFGHLNIASSLYSTTAESDQFRTLRQLAQLAVNMVDYVDPDDVSTPFVWNLPIIGTGPADPTSVLSGGVLKTYATTGLENIAVANFHKHLLFGTELPRLVVNEAYACVKNPTATGPATGLETRFWAELYNPLPMQDTNLSDNGAARLFYNPGSSDGAMLQTEVITPYQIIIADSINNAVTTNLVLSGNVTGNPNPDPAVLPGAVTANPFLQVGFDGTNDYAGMTTAITPTDQNEPYRVRPATVQPMIAATQNNGYYVIGPTDVITTGVKASMQLADDTTNKATDANTPASRGTDPVTGRPVPPSGMKIVYNAPFSDAKINAAAGKTYAVVLRRLANPYLPEQSNPALALYNPYVTVDAFEGVKPADKATNNDNPAPYDHTPTSTTPVPSVGRRHPYAALVSPANDQMSGMAMADPKNTFFAANDGRLPILPWLTHLDRQPLNSVELASVSAVGPSRLTNSFASLGPAYNRHTAEKLLMPISRLNANFEGGVTRLVSNGNYPPPPPPPPRHPTRSYPRPYLQVVSCTKPSTSWPSAAR